MNIQTALILEKYGINFDELAEAISEKDSMIEQLVAEVDRLKNKIEELKEESDVSSG